jgi:predicted aldo/keto reductase-like oxidoreductase
MIALKFLLGDENVEIVIPGMMRVSEVAENIAVASCTYYLNNPSLYHDKTVCIQPNITIFLCKY